MEPRKRSLFFHYVILSACLLLLTLSCSTGTTGPRPTAFDLTQDEAGAQDALERYLGARERGNFTECVRFLTKDFLKKFNETHGTDYADYFRNQNEDNFIAPMVVDLRERSDGTVVANVSVTVEGEGYRQKAVEQYCMIKEDGSWKIDDWQIEYSGEVDEWPFENE